MMPPNEYFIKYTYFCHMGKIVLPTDTFILAHSAKEAMEILKKQIEDRGNSFGIVTSIVNLGHN